MEVQRGATVMVAVLAAMCIAAPASFAGTTPASTFSKSGSDAASIASAGGPSGSAAAGDTIDWVLHYRNTTGAQAQVSITDPIGPGQAFVPGSLRVPPGLQARWSTNGGASYASTEPASGVDAVGASGTNVDGSTGAQTLSHPPSTGFVAGTGGGDGFEALFVGGNVYNVHHHRTAGGADTLIDCHVKSTGAECPGYAGGGTYASQTAGQALGTGADTLDTPYSPDAAVDRANGRIYIPVGVDGTASVGVVCVDVTNDTSCGYTRLNTQPGASTIVNGGPSPAQITGGATIGTKYYAMDTAGNFYCFDYSVAAACPGYPLAASVVDPGYANTTQSSVPIDSQVQSFDNRYVFAILAHASLTAQDLLCIDTTTDAPCSGYPVASYGGNPATAIGTPLAPLLDAGGNVTGICAEVGATSTSSPYSCWDLTAASAGAAPWGQMVAGATVGPNFGSLTRIGPRLYFAYMDAAAVATYTCWDFAANAACAGFVSASSGQAVYPYTLRPDPDNPDCIWEVGHNGRFEVFSATFGGTSCDESPASVAITPSAAYCDGGGGHVTGWDALAIGGVTPGDYSALAITITDGSGAPVPGWTSRVFPSTQQTIDISSIPASGATATLHVSASFGDLAAGVTATLTARWSGDPPQVCFRTVVGPAACAATPSLTNAANAVTVGENNVSDAPAGNGSGMATFVERAAPALCGSPPPAARRAPTPVLRLRKTSASRVRVGRRIAYRIRVTNPTSAAISHVRVCDRLPSGLAYVSSKPRATLSGGRLCWTIATLAAHRSRTFRITVRALAGAGRSRTNTATASAPGARTATAHRRVRVLGGAVSGSRVTG